ncbi:hypothetical protein JCM19992_19560 [Thermostilla marina]
MLAVIAAATLIGVLLAISVRQTASTLREIRVEAARIEAEILRDSAFELAAAKLQADPDYAGETWQPTLPEHRQDETAVVVVSVHRAETPSRPPSVQVTVHLKRGNREIALLKDRRVLASPSAMEGVR